MTPGAEAIFGGAGFVGRHLGKHLKQAGRVPISYDIGLRTDLQTESDDYRHCDVTKPIEIESTEEWAKCLYNLAAIHTTPGHQNHEYFTANIGGALNVCDFARGHDISTIVFTSSISVYGPGEDLKAEDSLTQPTSAYGSSKLTAEWIHRSWLAEDSARKLFIVRPGVVFGPGEGGNFTRLYRAMKKGVFVYPGRRDTLKGCIYVKDMVRALADLAASGDRYGLMNLSYPEPPTIEEVCEVIAEVTGLKAPRFRLPGPALKSIAATAHTAASLMGRRQTAFHPDRVSKLMVSTNISGVKLSKSQFAPRFTLREAIEDWYEECGRTGLF